MVDYTFSDLVESLEGRRRLGETPPVLLLGAGASAAAGLATMRRLYEAEGIAADAPDAFEQFCARMRKRNDQERFRWLAAHLQTADPHQVTPGYRALAALCAQHIFDIVLTANLDPLLEDAFSATALKRRDYLVLVNGVLRKERLPLLLLPGAPRVKVLKLHGDLFHRFMAWTPEEMEDYVRDITPVLAKALAYRDVLVVGYSLRDPAVRALALGTEGTVWFANPGPPAPEIAAELAAHGVRVIASPQCRFEQFFTGLAAALGVVTEVLPGADEQVVASAPRRAARSAARRRTKVAAEVGATSGVEVVDNLDEVLAATVGVIAGGDPGYVGSTGFLLAEPRVILVDAWVVGQEVHAQPDRPVRIVTQGGERFSLPQLGVVGGSPFGPLACAVPATLQLAGLRCDRRPVQPSEPIHVAVGTNIRRVVLEGGMTVEAAVAQGLLDADAAAALLAELRSRKRKGRVAAGQLAEWQQFALSQGTSVSGKNEALDIAPIGRVANMVQLRLATAPGSSGAPVVDARCQVRGFVVAGSLDPKQPESYMLPASWWGPRVAKLVRDR